MRNEKGKANIASVLKKIRIAALILLVAVLIGTIPVAAWFYHERKVAVVGEIDMPFNIRIDAAHHEDVIYLDLAGIDVENQEQHYAYDGTDYYYKDYAFTVSGLDVIAYKLQLAHTTNNQFRFALFRASESDTLSKDTIVSYSLREGSGTKYYEIMIGNNSPIAGHYLNKQNNALLGEDENVDTYGLYTKVNAYAEPLYWQTDDAIHANPEGVPLDEDGEFHDYFILRVLWENNRINDKETDILYIAAKAATE